MKITTFDVETTTFEKGNPFSRRNKLVLAGLKRYQDTPYLYSNWDMFVKDFVNHKHLVGFNIKFDLHWARRVGCVINDISVWDCQYADFILHNQTQPYRSLNDCLIEAGIPTKVDKVKQFWEQGIDTTEIPEYILSEYLIGDLEKTEQLFLHQYPLIKQRGLFPLMKLHMRDLLCLQEMEWNGIRYDAEASLKHAEVIDKEKDKYVAEINDIVGNAVFNLGSNDHLSVLLYGGILYEERRIPIGTFKTGKKIGQTRYKIEKVGHEFPRRYEPLEKTEVKKGGYWQVNEDVLRKLKPLNKKDKELIPKILEVSRLSKLSSTYLKGWPEFIVKKDWPKDEIHGSLNQCVAVTGRLSSTQPNQQNCDPLTKTFIYSRYA